MLPSSKRWSPVRPGRPRRHAARPAPRRRSRRRARARSRGRAPRRGRPRTRPSSVSLLRSPWPRHPPVPLPVLERTSNLGYFRLGGRGSSCWALPGRCPRRGRARRSGSRSAPRPCGGCRSRGRARARCSTVGSRRMRPTRTSSIPAALPGLGKSSTRTDGAASRSARACSAESGSSVSIQTASAWPTITGTRTQVAWIGRSGSSMILRVSARSFDSSSNSSPSKSQSMRRSCSVGRLVREPVHRLRAGAGDRLVGRDPDAGEAGLLVERLEDAGERDRAAVRVGDDAAVADRAGAVHLGDDERDPVLEPVGGGLVDRDRAARDGVRDELARGAGADREEEDVDVAARERLRRRLLDRVPADLAARRARRREDADVLEAVLAQQAERDGADGAGAADDADAGVACHGLRVAALRSDLAPARERAAERDLVGVLEVAADREAAREARDGDLSRGGGRRGRRRSPRRSSSGSSRGRPP